MEDYHVRHTSHACWFTGITERRSRTTSSDPCWVEKVNLHMNCPTITDHLSMGVLLGADVESQKNIIPIFLTAQGDIDLDKSGIALNRWTLPDGTCKQALVARILTLMKRAVRTVSPEDNINELDMHCKVIISQEHLISDVDDWMMQRAFEESAPRMVPASDSKSPRGTIVVDCDGVDGDFESCLACLGNFKGNDVLCMGSSNRLDMTVINLSY